MTQTNHSGARMLQGFSLLSLLFLVLHSEGQYTEIRRTFRFKSASPVSQILSSGNALQDHICYHFPLGEILSGVQLMDDSHLIMPLLPHKGLV